MIVREFDRMVASTQARMRMILVGTTDYRQEMDNLKYIIGIAFAECTSKFEEQTLSERLHETFEEYLKTAKGEIGA